MIEYVPSALPSLDEIERTIDRARIDAITELSKLGI